MTDRKYNRHNISNIVFRFSKLFAITIAVLLLIAMQKALCAPKINNSTENLGYTIGNIDIVTKAASAAQAKEIAIKRAKRKALQNLLNKLKIDDYGESSFSIGKISDKDIDRAVLDVSISNEQFGDKKYKGIFVIRFDKENLQSLLSRYGFDNLNIDLNKAKISSMLIVPILQVDDNAYLWDEGNGWRQYIENNYNNIYSPLAPITLASGDLSDISIASTEKILNSDRSALSLLMNKYIVDGILIAHIRNIAGMKKLYLSFFDGIEVHGLSHAYIDHRLPDDIFYQKAAFESVNAVESFLIDRYRSNNFGIVNKSLELIYDTNDISDFIKFRNTLDSVQSIKSYNVKSLSKLKVVFVINTDSPFNALKKDFSGYGFDLEKSELDSRKIFVTSNAF